ncbi:hypothetical protein D1224_13415 [Henriciella barbarensis]|uniref:Peptide methionine sulfoxide reductase n=1 Tax=Henriciella barbarensis TaxID=86342 RepID=A0A399QS49_9PROT|nr:hypothetical protein [Henriciella barbarensis]RIJ21311.1 hypothetical protein D1224_13415 [Henriciella barbarensis]
MSEQFLTALAKLPTGYSRGSYCGGSWGVTVERSGDGRRAKLYGEALGSDDHVSFNLYCVAGEPRLKPCETPAAKVIDFVFGFEPALNDG